MTKTNVLMSAAIAGLVGAALASNAMAADKETTKKVSVEKCYGINACKGHGKCGGEGHACAGQNSCKGQGWIEVIKGTCQDITGGSLQMPKAS